MSVLKKWLLAMLVVTLFFCGVNGVQAEDLNDTVKSYYEKPGDTKTDKVKDPQEDYAEKEEEPSEKVGITAWEFLRMIVATLFVVALLYFLLRFLGKKNKTYQKANSVENLGGTSLGTNRSIQLIKVGDRILIVGVGENIQLLKEIDNPEEYEKLLADYNDKLEQMIQPKEFAARLKNKWPSKRKTEPNEFSSEFKKQLNHLSDSRKKLMNELKGKGRNGS